MIAHIGNIPVQESLPFLVPMIALALFVWRKERRRREELERLPDAEDLLDERTVELVLGRWAESRHRDLGARHIPILYPPGPDETTAAQLAGRANCDTDTVQRLLVELEALGYVELEGYEGPDQAVSLTVEGYDLVNATEAVLLDAARGYPS
jgi:predicted transcriptional regulator